MSVVPRLSGWLSGRTPLALTVMPTGAPEPLGDRRGLRAGAHGTAAEQHHRALGGCEQLDGALDERGIRDRRGTARRQPLPGGAVQVEHVDRNADVHGPRPPGLEDLERPGERVGKVGRVADLDGVGRNGGHEGALVGQVMQRAVPPAVVGAGRGAGDDQQWDRVVVGAGDRRRSIGQAGTRDERADARLPRDAGVAVGHERGALLVSRGDVADVRGSEAAVDLEGVHPGDAEHGVGAVLLEQPDDRLAAALSAGRRRAAGLGPEWRSFGHAGSV